MLFQNRNGNGALERSDSSARNRLDNLYEIKLKDAQNFMLQLDHDPAHSVQVSRIAVEMFDQLERLHGCGEEERMLLECAALLHDIGWAISGKGHHKHSMALILQSDLPSFDEREKQITANVARYHRKALPKKKHSEFALLPASEQELICKLAAFVRLADGLDRSHTGNIRKLECSFDEVSCNIKLESRRSCKEEILAIQKKKNLFEKTYSRKLKAERKKISDSIPFLVNV